MRIEQLMAKSPKSCQPGPTLSKTTQRNVLFNAVHRAGILRMPTL